MLLIVNFGALIVDAVLKALSDRCGVERGASSAARRNDGDSGAGPSKGEGDEVADALRSTKDTGITLDAFGEAGGVSSCLVAMLGCLEGEDGMLRALLGLPNGLVGLSDAWLICDGRRTNGLAFSGDNEADVVL